MAEPIEVIARAAADAAFDLAFRGDTDGIDDAMALLFVRYAGQAREAERAHVIGEARRNLRLVQGCLDCNADDERRWSETIAWLEGLA